jgi:hypothetical protein
MPVELVTAAVLATGYEGAISLEVFNTSLNEPSRDVPRIHATRGMNALKNLVEISRRLPPFWETKSHAREALGLVAQRLQNGRHRL